MYEYNHNIHVAPSKNTTFYKLNVRRNKKASRVEVAQELKLPTLFVITIIKDKAKGIKADHNDLGMYVALA